VNTVHQREVIRVHGPAEATHTNRALWLVIALLLLAYIVPRFVEEWTWFRLPTQVYRQWERQMAESRAVTAVLAKYDRTCAVRIDDQQVEVPCRFPLQGSTP